MMPSFSLLGIAAICSVAVGFAFGYGHRDRSAAEEKLAVQRAGMDAYRQLELRYNASSADLQRHLLEDKLNVREPIIKEVQRIVERPVYRNDCFDDDGLRAANAALLNRAIPAARAP